jgi:hypothetical protein
MDIPSRAAFLLPLSSLEVCPCYNLDRNGFEQQDLYVETPNDPATLILSRFRMRPNYFDWEIFQSIGLRCTR